MKTIGLIGGTGWVSTVDYYKLINEGINKKLGGLDYARCLLYSFNYGDLDRLNKQNDDEAIYASIMDAAEKLMCSGADFLVLCANTLHKYADRLVSELDVPIVHIGEATANAIIKQGFSRIGLLGTKITMESDFYISRLKDKGIETIVPDEKDRNYINSIIFTELFQLQFKEETRRHFLDIFKKLQIRGVDGVVLGCTEIPLLIQKKHTDIPVFNTLEIHANAVVGFALNEMQK